MQLVHAGNSARVKSPRSAVQLLHQTVPDGKILAPQTSSLDCLTLPQLHLTTYLDTTELNFLVEGKSGSMTTSWPQSCIVLHCATHFVIHLTSSCNSLHHATTLCNCSRCSACTIKRIARHRCHCLGQALPVFSYGSFPTFDWWKTQRKMRMTMSD